MLVSADSFELTELVLHEINLPTTNLKDDIEHAFNSFQCADGLISGRLISLLLFDQ